MMLKPLLIHLLLQTIKHRSYILMKAVKGKRLHISKLYENMILTKVHFYVEMYQIMEHKKYYMRILKLDYGVMAYQVTQRASFFIN